MAKRTIENNLQSHDAALATRREILCVKNNEREIYYRTDLVDEEKADSTPVTHVQAGPLNTFPETPPQDLSTIETHNRVTRKPIDDIPISVMFVMKIIIAAKLKKDFHNISPDDSVKSLAKGKYH